MDDSFRVSVLPPEKADCVYCVFKYIRFIYDGVFCVAIVESRESLFGFVFRFFRSLYFTPLKESLLHSQEFAF